MIEESAALSVALPPTRSGEVPWLLRRVPSIHNLALLAVMASIFIIALAPRGDTDYWWHLKVGQYITTHHVVPSRDFMSFTFAGHPWTDHEWLAETLMYNLYRLAGLWGPIVFFAVVITIAFALTYANMRRRGISTVLALFVLTPAFVASTASWGPRIQMITLMLVSVYAYLLLQYKQTRNHRLLFAFPAIMLVWANIHAGFVLGLVLLAISLIGETLNRLARHEDALLPGDLKALLGTLVGTFAVTILNPNGFRQLLYPLTFVRPNAFTNLIQESASPDFHMLVMTVFEALLLLLVVSVWIARPRLDWTQLLLVLGFTHLALSQVRNVPLWCVLISPLLALYVQGSLAVVARRMGLPERRSRELQGRIVSSLNLAILVVLVVVYASLTVKFINPKALRASQATFPHAGIAYLADHKLPPRVYTTYEWGGFLLWNLYPRYRDFMDSRADTLYTPKILDAYLGIYNAAPQWKTILKQYRVQDVLVPTTVPIASVLAQNNSWRRVWSNSTTVLYVHR